MAAISEEMRPEEAMTGNTGNVDTTFRKTMRLKIAKRIARSTVGLQQIKGRSLWRGWLPQKQKKRLHME
jgi:hypothetical protein